MEFNYTQAASDRGNNHSFESNGRRASLCTSTILSKSPKFAPSIIALDAAIANAGQYLQSRQLDGYTGAAFERECNTQVALVKPAFFAAIKSVREIGANHAERIARATSFDKSAEPNASLRSDLRAWFLKHAPAERIVIAMSADYPLAASVFEAGQRVSGLDDGVWTQFTNRWMAINHIRKTGIDAAFAKRPSVENMTAVGTDTEAMNAAAKAAVDTLHTEAELLDDAEHYLQSVLGLLVVLTGKRAEELIEA